MPDIGSSPAEDVIPNLVANVGTFLTLHEITNCRAIRFTTAGTFIGRTVRSAVIAGTPVRTVTGVVGERIDVRFLSRTGGTADVDLLY
jgi:hypothetical protein